MIVTNIELVSAQGRSRDKHQARIEISNVGGTDRTGFYRYRIFGKANQKLHEGRVGPFPRKKLLALDLVLICLVDARGERVAKEVS
jgi:hypothetical protein